MVQIMNSSLSTIKKSEYVEPDQIDTESANLDWASVAYGTDKTLFLWRVFIWALTIIAIFGMAAALFWWQIDQGVGPGSPFSAFKIVRIDSQGEIDTSNKDIFPDFPESQPDGRFMVLAGSFVNDENATRIFDKLAMAGVPVRSRKAMVGGQQHTHLLVGPYEQQDTAELAVSLIRKRTDLPVDYTTMDDAGNTQSSLGTTDSQDDFSMLPDQFVVLVGSFPEPNIAEHIKQRLMIKQITANIKKVNQQDRTFFNVVVGPYRLATQANEMVDTILSKTGILAESTRVL